jgi:type IV secretion system protein VirD4
VKSYEFKNRILIMLVLSSIFSICLYVAMYISCVLQYGFENIAPGRVFETYTIMVEYWIKWSDNPDPRIKTIMLNILGPLSGAIFLFLITIFTLRAPLFDMRPFEKKESVHGDARWATEKDIKAAGLRAKEGVLMGNTTKGYLCAEGYQHILLFAPTGSGKGVGFVIPNLLFWKQSVVVHDIKLENYELTSGYRKDVMKQKVFLWNAASPDGITHCYNPLDWVSPKMGQMVDDIQKIGALLCPEQEFWENEARSLFVGVALYLLADKNKVASLGEVVRTLRSDDVVYNLAVVLDTMGDDIHPVSYMNLAAFLQKADKERSGVISTLNSKLELWTNPLIDAATATSDFDFNRIKFEPMTIYVGLTPDNIDRLKPLMQIFYQQAAQLLTKHMPRPEEKVGVLFIMDEFPTLGEMIQFKQGIAYFRGYNMRLFLIIQSTEQLKDIYDEAGMNSFLSNSTYRITFAANDVETANLISQLIGNKTVKQHSRNSPVFLDLNPASRSKTISEAQRALLLPQEVIGLARDLEIILIESSPPIKTKKIFYYKDKFFMSKLLKMSHVPTQEPYDPRKKKRLEEEQKRLDEEAKVKKEQEDVEKKKQSDIAKQKQRQRERQQQKQEQEKQPQEPKQEPKQVEKQPDDDNGDDGGIPFAKFD